MLIDVKRCGPLPVAPFVGQEVLNYTRLEKTT